MPEYLLAMTALAVFCLAGLWVILAVAQAWDRYEDGDDA